MKSKFSLMYSLICTAVFFSSAAQAQSVLPDCNVGTPGLVVGVTPLTVTTISGQQYAMVRVKSTATNCRVKVGMASYQKYDEIIRNQTVFNIDFGAYLNPGEERNLSVLIPPCASQVDVYQGEAITDYFSDYYCPGWPSNCRLVSAIHTNCTNPSAGGPCTGGASGTVNPAVPYCVRQPPVCNAGGSYSSGLECSASPKTIALSSNGSSGENITYSWSTTCPQGSVVSTTEANPTLTLSTLVLGGGSVSCQVNLTVTDKFGLSSNCSAALVGGTCNVDCAGTVNGSATVDECGVCQGDGSTCKQCDTTDIKGTQLSIDVNLAELKNATARMVRLIDRAIGVAKLTGRPASSVKASAATVLKSATASYVRGWQAVYTSIPGVILVCTSNTNCTSISTVAVKAMINSEATTLFNSVAQTRKILEQVLRKAPRSAAKSVRSIRTNSSAIIAKSKSALLREQKLIASIPDATSSCVQ